MDSLHNFYVAILVILACLAVLTAISRFCSRRIQNLSIQLNDYLIIPGLVFTLATTFMDIHGKIEHAPSFFHNVAPGPTLEGMTEDAVLSFKILFTMPIIWVLAVTFVRASILTLYIHIFPPRSFRLTCYLVLIINAGFCIGTIVADCLICQPISYRWDRSIKDGHCGTQKSLDLSIAIVNFILDLAVVTILMPTLWRLKMTVGKKVVLSGIFGMGVIICALTLYRIYITATMDQPRHKGLAYEMIGLLATLESLLGVISACLPMLRPIFGKLRALFSFGSRGSGAERIDSPTSERNKEPRVARIAATTSVLHQISTGLRKAAGKPTLGHDGGDDEHVLTRMDSRDFAKGSRDGATFTDGDISASVQYARNKVGDAAANVNEIYVRKDIDVDVDAGVSSTPHRPQRY